VAQDDLWQLLYNRGFAERVHRLGFSGLTASECGTIGRYFSGKGPVTKGQKVEVEELSLENITFVGLKKEHMRERARSLYEPIMSYSLTGYLTPPQTLWESRRREMRRWYRLVTTDPFAQLWSIELADCYLGDLDLYGLGQGLNCFFLYLGAPELRCQDFICHIINIWLEAMPLEKWGIKVLRSPVFYRDTIMKEALLKLGFFELGFGYLGRERVCIFAYKILNSLTN